MKTQSQDPDEAMATDSREAVAQGGEKGKKPMKNKGLRGSSKFWQKSWARFCEFTCKQRFYL